MFKTFLTGRLNRKQYIARYIATIAISIMVLIAIFIAYGITFDPSEENMAQFAIAPIYVLSVLATLATFSFDLRRIHDLNLPSKLILLPVIISAVTYIPAMTEGLLFYILNAVQLIFMLYLCIVKGTPGENQYGPQP